jgi:hypothetical protein
VIRRTVLEIEVRVKASFLLPDNGIRAFNLFITVRGKLLPIRINHWLASHRRARIEVSTTTNSSIGERNHVCVPNPNDPDEFNNHVPNQEEWRQEEAQETDEDNKGKPREPRNRKDLEGPSLER